MSSISTLFWPEPIQWGFRGDPYLWREMAGHLGSTTIPSSYVHLSALLEEAFLTLTGHPISYPGKVHVSRYAPGGMSSGMISTEFWRNTGTPLLLYVQSRNKVHLNHA